MKKLPTNKSVFRKVIEENCCYVDKTPFIKQMLDAGDGYWFLSRPRRFGKTLFLDTIRAAFSGEKELFNGLFLENNWDWNVKYPVIRISLASGTVESKEELNTLFSELLDVQAEEYGVILTRETLTGRFNELIGKLNKKFNRGVVVLVDEYDKPLLDNLAKNAAEEIREGLSSFYSVLKDADRYVKFVFLTGVSKFSKTSIFSNLNNLTDISLSPRYADICGYTQREFETVFEAYLSDVDLKKVQSWYDGYNFLGSNVYNPYDILLFLSEKRYQCYWFETGTPSFLLGLIKQNKYFLPDLNTVQLSDTQMGEFDIHNIELEVLLYQAGYLTIKNSVGVAGRTFYALQIPNKEVDIGFNDYLLRMFFAHGADAGSTSRLSMKIFNALDTGQPELLENAFYSFFAGIPHQWYIKNNIAEYEGYYCSVFYAFFAALGLTMKAEENTNKGRIDFTIIMEKGIYIFEIKMDSNPKDAIEQIRERKYHEKYLHVDKNIFLIGIEFDEKNRNISNFAVDTVC